MPAGNLSKSIYRGLSGTDEINKKQLSRKKKHAPLKGSVRGYIREISVAMFLRIQTDIYIYLEECGPII